MADQPHVTEDVDLARLEEIFEETFANDRASKFPFMQAVQAIDWAAKDADAFAAVARMAISLNNIKLARQLLSAGLERFPANEDLSRLAHVLAPAKILARNLPPVPSLRDSRAWLREHHLEYFDQWVALKGGTLLGAAETRKQLLEMIGPISREDNVLVTRIADFET